MGKPRRAHAHPARELNYCSIGAVSDERAFGASKTPAAAVKIRAVISLDLPVNFLTIGSD